MDELKRFADSLLDKVPNILFAIILLVLAFVVAKVVRSLVTKLLNLPKVEKLLGKIGIKPETTKTAKDFIAKLAYFITFIVFLPGVLDKLEMHSVSTPISNLASDFISFIPKLISAGIILAIGIFIAKIVKDLLTPVLKATKIDSLQEKSGIKATEKTALSSIIVNLIYGFILLIVISAALDKLEITSISGPTNAIVSSIFAAIPNILSAVVIIALGIFISNLVTNLLETFLAGVGADTVIEKITGSPAKKIVLSKLIATIVRCIMIGIFLIQGINVLGLPVLTGIGQMIISYIPTALSIALILIVGIFGANTVESAISNKFPKAKASAFVAKTAIYVVLAFLCLSQLGIANAIVESTFIIIVAAVGIAFAVSFGIGGKTFAANTLKKLEDKFDDNNKAE